MVGPGIVTPQLTINALGETFTVGKVLAGSKSPNATVDVFGNVATTAGVNLIVGRFTVIEKPTDVGEGVTDEICAHTTPNQLLAINVANTNKRFAIRFIVLSFHYCA